MVRDTVRGTVLAACMSGTTLGMSAASATGLPLASMLAWLSGDQQTEAPLQRGGRAGESDRFVTNGVMGSGPGSGAGEPGACRLIEIRNG